LKYLDDHESIAIKNAIGHEFEIRKETIIEFVNIIIYDTSGALPDDCRSKRHHVSKTVGFIHIIGSLDYLSILHVFSTPEDFRQYLKYREKCLTEIGKPDNQITENDIIGSFIHGDEFPSPGAQQVLQRIAMEMELLEFQDLLSNLRNNIHTSEDPHSYYAVLQQFARVPRLIWREVGLRVLRQLMQRRRLSLKTDHSGRSFL
jgi:hypothetical protein